MRLHYFLRGLLCYYKIELQHLTRNGIQHITVFIAMCEGFLRIEPHFKLWRYSFMVSMSKRMKMVFPMGAPASTFGGTAPLSTSGWTSPHPTRGRTRCGSTSRTTARPLFLSPPARSSLTSWIVGITIQTRRLLGVIRYLRRMGIISDGIICAYLKCRLAPLMAQRLPMYVMMVGADREGMSLSMRSNSASVR